MQYLLTQEELDDLKFRRLTRLEIESFEKAFNEAATSFITDLPLLKPLPFTTPQQNAEIIKCVKRFIEKGNALALTLGPKNG